MVPALKRLGGLLPLLASQINFSPPATLPWGGDRVSVSLLLWQKAMTVPSPLVSSAAPACSGQSLTQGGTISLPEAGWHPPNHSHADPAALGHHILSCPLPSSPRNPAHPSTEGQKQPSSRLQTKRGAVKAPLASGR